MKSKSNRPASTAMTAAGTAKSKLPEPTFRWAIVNDRGQLTPLYDSRCMCAVIPLTSIPSAAKLKAIQRLLEMSEEKLHKTIYAAMDYQRYHGASDQTEAIVRALGLLSTARRGGRSKQKS